jgi:hypothetical protein
MNRESFYIHSDWTVLDERPAEVGDTYAELKIEINGWTASENYDSYSKYMRDSAVVSAYPMALWIAFYWWRIIYEPCPSKWKYGDLSFSWRSAHELTSSGNGFIWPPLRFVPDGERVLVFLQPSTMRSPSTAQYIKSGKASVDRGIFESGLNDFLAKTIDRLELMGHKQTELQNLWQEVQKERRDPDASLYRIIEASLGYNPDEGPDGIIGNLADKTETAGFQPILEIAAACSAETVEDPLAAVGGIIDGNANGLPAIFDYGSFPSEEIIINKDKPWETGHAVAKHFRQHLNYGNSPIKNDQLASLFCLQPKVLAEGDISMGKMSLGVPDESRPDRLKLYFHQKHQTGRRFYLARILGEHLINLGQPSNWLPATCGLTWRQKYQRAFASEFLCPFRVLEERMSTAIPDDALFAPLAEQYLMEEHRLENHWKRNISDTDGGLLSL